MNKSLIRTAAAAAVIASGVAGAQTYSTRPMVSTYGYGNDAGARLVRCESIGSRNNFCRIDARGGVQISRQLSQQTCIRGRNWQATADGISVTDGCRAEFVVYSGYGDRYSTTNGAYTTDRYGRPVYDNRYGTYNGSYTTDRYGNRVYVDQGGYTRDRYGRRVYVGYPQTTSYGERIHCQGTGHGRTYCGTRGAHYTMIDRSPSCLVNRTWGTDAYGTWVSGNCNADFALDAYYGQCSYDPGDEAYERNRALGPYGTDGVYTPGTYSNVSDDEYDNDDDQIVCDASGYGRTYCGDRTRSYSLRRASGSNCVAGENYGRDSGGIWVSGSCGLILDPDD